MAFIAMVFASIFLIISAVGAVMSAIGVIFLIVFLLKKSKKKKGFLIAAIILLILGIPAMFTFYTVTTTVTNASIDTRINPKEYPVNNAIERRDTRKLEKYLKNGADPNEARYGRSAIFRACSNFDAGINYEAAKILIRYHADIFAKADNGNPLMISMFVETQRLNDQEEQLKIINLLLENGYDANQSDDDGTTLLMYAVRKSRYEDSVIPFEIARRLIEYGADINAADNLGRSALMLSCASFNYDYELIQYLIDEGADIQATDMEGRTSLDYFKRAEGNVKDWTKYETIGQSQEYLDTCKAIERLLEF